MKIKFDFNKNELFFKTIQSKIEKYHIYMHKDETNKMLGWVTHPIDTSKVLDRIVIANLKKFKYDTLVLVGIGGSILASKAIIEALPKKINVLYMGERIESYSEVFCSLKNKKPLFHLMSKSGDTLETLLCLEQIKQFLQTNDKPIQNHMLISTGNMKGYLYNFALKNNITCINIFNNFPGRYSVLSPHLTNIILAKLDVNEFIDGAKEAYFKTFSKIKNDCYYYAVDRYFNYRIKKNYIEVISTFNSKLDYFAEWVNQLFSESEGKNNKGILPISLKFSKDLHSYEQYLQQGRRMMFETFITVAIDDTDDFACSDKTNPVFIYKDKSYDEINMSAYKAVKQAHNKIKLPNSSIILDRLDEYTFGYLFYFFMKACAMSCMLMGANPYNQPGVEEYKSNMRKNKNS